MSEEINYVGDTGGDAYLDVSFYKNFFNGEETDFVKINLPGDKTLTIDTIAEDSHKARFKRQWNAYVGYRDMTGTPISKWEEIADALRTELGYLGFKFVEQVAGAPDQAFARIMGGVQIRTKAQSFLNRGKIDADVVIAKQGEQIQELTEKLDLLTQTINNTATKTTK